VSGKTLESFAGDLICFDGDEAVLSLTSLRDGTIYFGRYPAKEFTEKGIDEGDLFVCKTVESDAGVRIEIEAVPDKELTEADLHAIRDKINKVLPEEDPGVLY
jgi:hypothetical protein